jgi:hypothetical protein
VFATCIQLQAIHPVQEFHRIQIAPSVSAGTGFAGENHPRADAWGYLDAIAAFYEMLY